MKRLIFSVIFVLNINFLLSNNLKIGEEFTYIIELKNGDIFSGYITEMINSSEEGEGIKFVTELGTATIYMNQIKSLNLYKDYYRHKHRIFLLPTAEAIGDDHFIGNFELGLFYAGFGLFDVISVTTGRSFIPSINSNHQISLGNIKFTLMNIPLDNIDNKNLIFSAGLNLGFINHNNRLVHYYATGTLSLERTAISASVYTKYGNNNYYRIYFGENALDMNYANGSFGLAIGIDTRFSNFHNLHFIGELWNSDITKPTNSAVFLGLRLASSNFSSDFGFAFFTQPFVIPFCSFVWTPLKN